LAIGGKHLPDALAPHAVAARPHACATRALRRSLAGPFVAKLARPLLAARPPADTRVVVAGEAEALVTHAFGAIVAAAVARIGAAIGAAGGERDHAERKQNDGAGFSHRPKNRVVAVTEHAPGPTLGTSVSDDGCSCFLR